MFGVLVLNDLDGQFIMALDCCLFLSELKSKKSQLGSTVAIQNHD